MSTYNNSSKFVGKHQADGVKRIQANEETNDTSSGDDPEEPTDGRRDESKIYDSLRKPGKLDLSQFDNITNAIGKLNVQPTLKVVEVNHNTHSSIYSDQALQEGSQDLGFFRNRVRKTKNRIKDSSKRATRESNSNDQLASFSKDRCPEVRNFVVSSDQETKIHQIRKPPRRELPVGSLKNFSGLHDEDHATSHFEHDTRARDTSEPTSSSGQESLDTNAIRCRAEEVKIPSRLSQSSEWTSPSTFASTASASKRINNPRQNHGRAVAPPQLPGGLLIDMKSRLDREPTVSDRLACESSAQTSGEDGFNNFSQSPITQRFLKHSKNHIVSELDSPYGSDCDLYASNLLRRHTSYRGKDPGSENTQPATFSNSSIDSSELINSREAAIKQLNKILANRQPPGRLAGPLHAVSRSSSLDQEHQQLSSQVTKKNDKDIKKDKKKSRDDEKLEKRRLKEEERLRKQEKKLSAKKSKSTAVGSGRYVDDDGIPVFIKRCIEYIEFEGMDAEGIYRVPGNRAHVDALLQKFKDNPDTSIAELDIPVNAVATALKDFLSKKCGPVIPLALMNELTELSTISERDQRVQAVRRIITKLPSSNLNLLRYVFSHFVKISKNHSLNSMDSKNLAICWWPTLLPLHFNDMIMFEQMRPYLEESIQTMIDQYDLIFESDGPTANYT